MTADGPGDLSLPPLPVDLLFDLFAGVDGGDVADFTAGRVNRRGRPRGYCDWRPQARTRALLDEVRGVLARYEDYLPLTCRQIFYALVGNEALDKTERAYERLCEHLNRARRAGLIPFDTIRDDGVSLIADRSYADLEDFHRETARRAQQFRRNRQQGQPYFIELWAEAAGMVPQLSTVARRYSIPVYSAGGFASLSANYSIAQRALDRDRPTLLLHVGDFDPSGESIFAAMAQDAAAFVIADRIVRTLRLESVRVALTAQQVDHYKLPTAPAKATDSRSRRWAGQTCQLEALPPDELARVVEQAILDHTDATVLSAVVGAEQRDRAELLGLPPGERP